jgi:ferrochelatase
VNQSSPEEAVVSVSTAPSPAKAVLLMAYGSPRSPEEILPYYTHMRGGRTPSPEAVAELKARYAAIGGHSPLTEITIAQAEGLEVALNANDGDNWSVYVGMKHSHPFIEDTVREMAEKGVEQAVGIVLAPHYSVMSIAGYVERAIRTAGETAAAPQLSFVQDWHLHPGYVSWLAQRVAAQLAKLGEQRGPRALVIFTAHSLPARLREMGDPYPDQLGETAAAVAAELRLDHWTTGWQSVAQTAGEPWLGPELLDVVRSEKAKGTDDFVVCACGFVADHLEILFDLDVEAQREASGLGVTILRTDMPNADPGFLEILADLARKGISAAS